MTTLQKPVTRETRNSYRGRPVILTVAPCGSNDETLLGLRLKGTRTQYVVALSDVFRVAAVWHGQKEAAAKKAARKAGISWRIARKQFLKETSL